MRYTDVLHRRSVDVVSKEYAKDFHPSQDAASHFIRGADYVKSRMDKALDIAVKFAERHVQESIKIKYESEAANSLGDERIRTLEGELRRANRQLEAKNEIIKMLSKED